MSIIKGTLGSKIEKKIEEFLEVRHTNQMNYVKNKHQQTTAEFKNWFAGMFAYKYCVLFNLLHLH